MKLKTRKKSDDIAVVVVVDAVNCKNNGIVASAILQKGVASASALPNKSAVRIF